MTGLDVVFALWERGVRFRLDANRSVTVSDPAHVVTGAERVLLAAVKFDLCSLLMTELPDGDPGADACDKLDAAEGVAYC